MPDGFGNAVRRDKTLGAVLPASFRANALKTGGRRSFYSELIQNSCRKSAAQRHWQHAWRGRASPE
jgi:hypothetical protein